MNNKALIELTKILLDFENYEYSRKYSTFTFTSLTSKEFTLLHDLISRHNLKFKIDCGLIIWLN